MSAQTLVTYLRSQGVYCSTHGSPMYGIFCEFLAADVDAGGPVAGLLDRWTKPDARVGRDVPALRLLGGVHRIVLSGRAGRLARFYPSVGGSDDPRDAWPALARTIAAHEPALRAALEHPPQTNEVGRAVALLGGLRFLATESGGMPIRLVEIGASAGLNLRVDRLPIGPGLLIDAPIPFPDAPDYRIVSRIGGDLAPVNPTTPDGELALMSYVWPDDVMRLDRLRTAIDVARVVPVNLRRVGAADLVESLLPDRGTVLVVWHSVMWQYVGEAERERVLAGFESLGSSASADARVAHLSLEPGSRDRRGGSGLAHELWLTTWPGRIDQLLGEAPAHGVPVRWNVPGA